MCDERIHHAIVRLSDLLGRVAEFSQDCPEGGALGPCGYHLPRGVAGPVGFVVGHHGKPHHEQLVRAEHLAVVIWLCQQHSGVDKCELEACPRWPAQYGEADLVEDVARLADGARAVNDIGGAYRVSRGLWAVDEL
ncbi:hypothetical protein OIE68_39690 [Nocardia vinacea]|uniref:hypothetical protein n=1 Tax=Nocardia vinacea TaxID=96468 RepID=UPI002E134589|nr:hypothetical protein OIE68_39690 [Nocardia vinacea]